MKTIETNNGTKVCSPWDDDWEALAELEHALRMNLVSDTQRSFAESLVYSMRNHRASTDQIKWVHVLAARAVQMTTLVGAKIPFGKVTALLSKASASGLKWPRLRLPSCVVKTTRRGRIVVIADGQVIGAVADDEELLVRDEPASQRALADLRALAEDPIKAGSAFGLRTNRCCFCGLELTTAESVGNGWGPVCAAKWGLLWADSTAAKVERAIRISAALSEAQRGING